MAYQTAWRILGNITDTEDAVQAALMDALRIHRKRTVQNWGGLLRHLSSCRALDLLRKRGRFADLPADAPGPRSCQPDAVAIATESVTLLRKALTQLSEREAAVFSL